MPYVALLACIALLLYCTIDVLQSDAARVRALPRLAWLALVVLIPFLGPVAWLVWGRPGRDTPRTRTPAGRRGVRSGAPDDDPEFLAALARTNRQRERERRRQRDARPPDDPGPSA